MQSLKVFASFASLIRQFANRLIAKEERSKRKLWRNLKLSAFVVGAAPWLIPDPGSHSKNYENELTASECKFYLAHSGCSNYLNSVQRCHILYMVKYYNSFARERALHKTRYYATAVLEIFLIFLAPLWYGFTQIKLN